MGYLSRGRESCSVTVHDYALAYVPLRWKQCRPALFSSPSPAPFPIKESPWDHQGDSRRRGAACLGRSYPPKV